MNVDGLITEIQSIVDNGASFSDAQILAYLNKANIKIANRLYLPWLENGTDTVTTDTTTNITMPADFHRNLFMATTEDGGQLTVASGLRALADMVGTIQSDENGSVSVVCVSAGRLCYQDVPETATDITLFYYRRPAVLAIGDDLEWDNDDFDSVLVNYAAWKMFELLEQGEEGQKISTMYHKSEYKEDFDSLKTHCIREGRSFVTPNNNKVW